MGTKINEATVIYVNIETRWKWLNIIPLFIYIEIIIFYIKVTVDLHSPRIKNKDSFQSQTR